MGTMIGDGGNQITCHPNQSMFEKERVPIKIVLGQQLHIEIILDKLGHVVILVITPCSPTISIQCYEFPLR